MSSSLSSGVPSYVERAHQAIDRAYAAGADAERGRIIARLVGMADALDQDAIACTAETLRRAAAVLDVEGEWP